MNMSHEKSFTAANEHGDEHTIHVYRHFHTAASFMHPDAPDAPGMMELQTDDGLHVNLLSKGRYQIIQTGELLFSDDPDVP